MKARSKIEKFYQRRETVVDYDKIRFGSSGGKLVGSIELQGILSLLPDRGRILDVGAGTGRVTKLLLKKGYQVSALDSSEEMVKKLGGIKNKKLSVYLGSAFSFAFPKETYDGITALRFFDHFDKNDFKSILKEFKRVLKKGGIAVFGINNRFSLESILPTVFSKAKPLNFYYSEKELEKIFSAMGWVTKRKFKFFIIPRGFYMHLPWPIPKVLLIIEKLMNKTPLSYFSSYLVFELEKK